MADSLLSAMRNGSTCCPDLPGLSGGSWRISAPGREALCKWQPLLAPAEDGERTPWDLERWDIAHRSRSFSCISQTIARMFQSVLPRLPGSWHKLLPLSRTPDPSYLLGCFVLILEDMSPLWHLPWMPVPRAADTHRHGHINLMELIHMVSTEATLMPDIRFQDGIWCFLTHGCLAFLYYSAMKMTEKASLVEIIVQDFEKSAAILIE